MAVVMFI